MAPKSGKKKSASIPSSVSPTPSQSTTSMKVGTKNNTSKVVVKGPYDDRKTTLRDRIYLTIVFLFAAFIRTYKIYYPTSVVFDEVHFGGFARKYIIGRYFMDVHPPLAKMLFAAVGYLAGYDGEFLFAAIGDDYLEPNVPYVPMRLFPATLGVFVIGLFYLTLRASGCKSGVAFLGAMLLTIENALVTQSRLILLDSPLIFFMALTIYAQKKFEIQSAFSLDWYRYLCLTGLGLGATVSSKWYGLFTIGWVGVLTVWQLWFILGDLRVSAFKFVGHFTARAIGLIAIPIVFYMAMFFISFLCLSNTGDGASFMSPAFQQSLKHAPVIPDSPADIYIGSQISIRHVNTQGGYLHSHDHLYVGGSGQQQVTLYPHRDTNNIWLVENSEIGGTIDDSPLTHIEDGMLIKLKHVTSNRRLHSHDVRPPVTEQDYQNEVSAYGYDGFDGDANDIFKVEIVKSRSAKGPSQDRLRTIESQFQLVHVYSGCVLFSHNVKLPKWAFEQQEVTCVKGPTFENTLWYVETNTHPNLGDDVEKINYKNPSFLSKFVELNKVMWRVNAGLTESHHWESRPESWPLLKRGINFWVKDHRQVYLLGNPIIWWSSSLAIAVYVVFKIFAILRQQRGFKDFQSGNSLSVFDSGVGSFVIGWAFHYFPSFIMERQLFLHHYLCSLYFACLVLTQTFNYLAVRISLPLIKRSLALIFFALSAAAFLWYSPLIYATPWTKSLCEKSKFFDMDFDCNSFLDTYDAYKEYDEAKASEIINGEGLLESNLVEQVQGNVPGAQVIKVVEEPVAEVQNFIEPAVQIVEEIQQGIEGAAKQAQELAQPVAEQVVEAVKPVVEQAQEAAKPVVEQARDAVEPVVEQAQDAIEPVVEQVQETAEKAIEQIQEVIEPVAEQSVEDAIEPVVEQVQETAEKAIEQIQEVIEPVAEQSVEDAKPIIEQAEPIPAPVADREPVTEEFHRSSVVIEVVTSNDAEPVESVPSVKSDVQPLIPEGHIIEPETIQHDEL